MKARTGLTLFRATSVTAGFYLALRRSRLCQAWLKSFVLRGMKRLAYMALHSNAMEFGQMSSSVLPLRSYLPFIHAVSSSIVTEPCTSFIFRLLVLSRFPYFLVHLYPQIRQ